MSAARHRGLAAADLCPLRHVRKIAADNPAEAHSYWRQERDRMFGTHPASP